uniref:Uncharacterized protein n=1 Tax=Rhizophora mucronata TaxID=61149 RepID=A0A2P2MUS3_RHIMU
MPITAHFMDYLSFQSCKY